jgi:UDP-glucose 4-epimerase
MSNAIVTGGAGFIGSHLAKRLAANGYQVKVIDNFISGKVENLAQCDKKRVIVIRMDLTDRAKVLKEVQDAEVVYHFAADPDVKSSGVNPSSHFKNNVEATYNVLEACRLNKIQRLVFSSSSVVYGEAKIMPTPEDFSPLDPISIYGATKLACEAMINGYVRSFGLRALIFRPANIIGSGGTHGVILDFIKKLRDNPRELEILGDGTQQKSYLHISDFVEALMISYHHFVENSLDLDIYNAGSYDSTNVKEIANIVMNEMGLKNVNTKFTSGAAGGRGWVGDVKIMLLAVNKLAGLGWRPSLNSREAVKLATHELLTGM